MFEQIGEGVVNGLGINHVVVVKDEEEGVQESSNIIQQHRQHGFNGRG
jgi:hypothetical protein